MKDSEKIIDETVQDASDNSLSEIFDNAENEPKVPDGISIDVETDTNNEDGNDEKVLSLSLGESDDFSEEFVFADGDAPVFEEMGFEDEDGDTILPPDKLFSEIKDSEEEKITSPDKAEEEKIHLSAEEDGQLKFIYPEEESVEETPTAEKPSKEEIYEYNPKKPRRIDGIFDLIELFVFTLLAVMLITSFFFRHSVVDGHSMENTLEDGEHLIISDLFYTPKRGDIIVCEDYTTQIRKPIVKRVIAVAGDSLIIKSNGEIYVNGKLLDESAYVHIDNPNYKYENFSIPKIPEGKIFVMGDHRNSSTDSRDIGAVSVDSVLGKVLFRFYPFDRLGTVD